MKKLLLGLGSALTIAAPITAVVSCTPWDDPKHGQDDAPAPVAGMPAGSIDLTAKGSGVWHGLFHVGGRSLPKTGTTLFVVVGGKNYGFTWTSQDSSQAVPAGYLTKAKTQDEMVDYLASRIAAANSGVTAAQVLTAFGTLKHHTFDTTINPVPGIPTTGIDNGKPADGQSPTTGEGHHHGGAPEVEVKKPILVNALSANDLGLAFKRNGENSLPEVNTPIFVEDASNKKYATFFTAADASSNFAAGWTHGFLTDADLKNFLIEKLSAGDATKKSAIQTAMAVVTAIPKVHELNNPKTEKTVWHHLFRTHGHSPLSVGDVMSVSTKDKNYYMEIKSGSGVDSHAKITASQPTQDLRVKVIYDAFILQNAAAKAPINAIFREILNPGHHSTSPSTIKKYILLDESRSAWHDAFRSAKEFVVGDQLAVELRTTGLMEVTLDAAMVSKITADYEAPGLLISAIKEIFIAADATKEKEIQGFFRGIISSPSHHHTGYFIFSNTATTWHDVFRFNPTTALVAGNVFAVELNSADPALEITLTSDLIKALKDVMDLDDWQQQVIEKVYNMFATKFPGKQVALKTYFNDILNSASGMHHTIVMP